MPSDVFFFTRTSSNIIDSGNESQDSPVFKKCELAPVAAIVGPIVNVMQCLILMASQIIAAASNLSFSSNEDSFESYVYDSYDNI